MKKKINICLRIDYEVVCTLKKIARKESFDKNTDINYLKIIYNIIEKYIKEVESDS